jgi:large subunit ribosomal protein L1
MRTSRSGPVVKDSIKLPHPISGDDRIAVICPEDSTIAADALAAGAVLAGEETIFKAIRAGEIHFTKLICHTASEPALNKANLGRILGPKGLMPNKKTHTITANLKSMMRDMVGTINYRERAGVVRMVIGQLNHSPKQLSDNLSLFMKEVKNSIRRIASQGKQTKALHEVVLSTTHGPGLSLNGLYSPTDDGVTPEDLATAM